MQFLYENCITWGANDKYMLTPDGRKWVYKGHFYRCEICDRRVAAIYQKPFIIIKGQHLECCEQRNFDDALRMYVPDAFEHSEQESSANQPQIITERVGNYGEDTESSSHEIPLVQDAAITPISQDHRGIYIPDALEQERFSSQTPQISAATDRVHFVQNQHDVDQQPSPPTYLDSLPTSSRASMNASRTTLCTYCSRILETENYDETQILNFIIRSQPAQNMLDLESHRLGTSAESYNQRFYLIDAPHFVQQNDYVTEGGDAGAGAEEDDNDHN